jgi:hypothetical protein
MSAIDDYYAALDRLKYGAPIVVPVGTRINKDTVAMEAGRKRGSIKASREQYMGLIADIDLAAQNAMPRDAQLSDRLRKTKQKLKELKGRYLSSLNREIILSNRLRELEAMLEAKNVTAIGRKE